MDLELQYAQAFPVAFSTIHGYILTIDSNFTGVTRAVALFEHIVEVNSYPFAVIMYFAID